MLEAIDCVSAVLFLCGAGLWLWASKAKVYGDDQLTPLSPKDRKYRTTSEFSVADPSYPDKRILVVTTLMKQSDINALGATVTALGLILQAIGKILS